MSRVFALPLPQREPPPGLEPLPQPARDSAPTPLADRGLRGVRPAATEAAELYEAWAHRVRGYICFRVREPSDVDDLVGEVFRRVVSGPAPAEPGARPAWIFRVTHNVVVDHYRRRRFPLLPDLFDRADDAPSLPERVIRDERVRATDSAMRRLPGRQRAAIYLRYYEDLPFEAVAEAMGIPSSTARTLVHRGLKRLALALGQETDR
jgi:RNA polymerase sigma factor (sigma-70 family)